MRRDVRQRSERGAAHEHEQAMSGLAAHEASRASASALSGRPSVPPLIRPSPPASDHRRPVPCRAPQTQGAARRAPPPPLLPRRSCPVPRGPPSWLCRCVSRRPNMRLPTGRPCCLPAIRWTAPPCRCPSTGGTTTSCAKPLACPSGRWSRPSVGQPTGRPMIMWLPPGRPCCPWSTSLTPRRSRSS